MQEAPDAPPGVPGLNVDGDGTHCQTVTGSFTIKGIRFDAAGAVTFLSATFVQHCEGLAPALRGTIAWHA